MTTPGTDISPSTAARIAGVSLLLMAVIAILVNFFVTQGLVVTDDAVKTASNIAGSEELLRVGALMWPVVAILDVVVALALYVVFRPVNRSVSLLAGWLRLAYAAVFAAGMFNFLGALKLLSGAEFLNVLATGQLQAQALLALNAFDDNWTIALLFFGAHLAVLGYLAYRSGYVPKVLGLLLLLTAASYLLTSSLTILVADHGGTVALIINIPAFIGELIFALWLLIRAKRIPGAAAA